MRVKGFEKTVLCFSCPKCNHYHEIDSRRLSFTLDVIEFECEKCDKLFYIELEG